MIYERANEESYEGRLLALLNNIYLLCMQDSICPYTEHIHTRYNSLQADHVVGSCSKIATGCAARYGKSYIITGGCNTTDAEDRITQIGNITFRNSGCCCTLLVRLPLRL
jgi:hypothetical protein